MGDEVTKELDASARRITKLATKERVNWENYLQARGDDQSREQHHEWQMSLHALRSATRRHEDIEKRALEEVTR